MAQPVNFLWQKHESLNSISRTHNSKKVGTKTRPISLPGRWKQGKTLGLLGQAFKHTAKLQA